MPAQHSRQAHAADHSNPGASKQGGDHQRQRKQSRPERCETQRSSGHCIRANARRIVIWSAGDKARPEEFEEALDATSLHHHGRLERDGPARGFRMGNDRPLPANLWFSLFAVSH